MVGEKFVTDLLTAGLTPEMKVAFWRFLITAALGIHIMMACGLIPGVQGFAWAGDVHNNTQAITALSKTVDCIAINAEIKRLRSELRTARTKLFEAQQENNTALVQFVQESIEAITTDITDQEQQRNSTACPVK